jgi:hypothetical protein
MPGYEAARFDPPAPVARVVLRNPASTATVSDTLLLLDTGADITLLPRAAVERLGIAPLANQRYELMGFDGSRSFAPVAVLDMVFLNRAFRGQYLLIEKELGIMGRDVLNLVTLLLDGPRQQWAEYVPPNGI